MKTKLQHTAIVIVFVYGLSAILGGWNPSDWNAYIRGLAAIVWFFGFIGVWMHDYRTKD